MLSTFRRLYTVSKKANMRYSVLKVFLAVAVGLFIGGAALSLGASEAYAASPQTQGESSAAVGTASGEQADDGSATLLLFMGGTLLLILFVVVVTVATATSTAAIAGADEV